MKLLEGASYRSIAIETGLDQRTIAKHAKAGHGMKPVIAQAGRTKAVKESLELAKCQKEIYDKAMKAANMALGELETPATANLSVFGQCIAPATKIVEVLAKVDPEKKDGDGPKVSAFRQAYGERAKVVFDGTQT